MANVTSNALNDFAKGQLGVLKVALQTQDGALIKYQLGKLKVASELNELCSLVEKGANAQVLAMIDELLAFKVSEKCEFDDECFARLVKWADDNKIAVGKFPREKERLAKLKELDLGGCDLKTLPDEFANLQSLEKLVLSSFDLTHNNEFQEFPKALCGLKNLKELNLEHCDLESLPDEFANLQSLERLKLSNNEFQEFPKALCGLKNLKELDLSSCDLKSLPDEFANLQNLERLDLGLSIFYTSFPNRFQEFPKSINILARLKNLKTLSLMSCGLNSLPNEFANLQSLESLDLSQNEFQEFPKALCELKNLKGLVLSWCGLKSLPDEFANLQSLEKLNLARNKFQEFPEIINKLKNLKEYYTNDIDDDDDDDMYDEYDDDWNKE